MKHRIKYLAVLAVLASSLAAQEAKAPPKLKPEVEISLRTLREQISNQNIELLQIEKQYRGVQEQLTSTSIDYNSKFKTALKDSDIDETKYILDGSTLAVRENPNSTPATK